MSDMRIALLSGAYPPAVDGIGDYTHLLAKAMAGRHEVTVFTGIQNSFTAADRVSVLGVFHPSRPATVTNLFPAVLQSAIPDRLIVQYNPFGFGPRGFNPWLPLTLARLRKHVPISVMFHETYVPCESAAQFAMRLWQIPQFFFLCRMADSLFASCDRWLPAIRRASGREAVSMPVGSNVERSRLSRGEARARLEIGDNTLVLGVFGSAHPSRLLDWISHAANRLQGGTPDILLLYIGADGEKVRSCLGPDVRFLDCGLLPADAVGDHLMAMDMLLAPFIDGLSTRRGSVAAAFQHGIPVVSTSSAWTDALLLREEERLVFLSPIEKGMEAFVSLTGAVAAQVPFSDSRRLALRIFYDQHFPWTQVSSRFAGDLLTA